MGAMGKALTATYDGSVLRPDESLDLEANTRVRLTIEEAGVADNPAPGKEADGFRRAAGSWKDLIDCDLLVRDIYKSRSLQTRQEPHL